MTKTEPLLTTLDLKDELFVISTLLTLIESSDPNMPVLMEICADSVARCQELAEKLVQTDSCDG